MEKLFNINSQVKIRLTDLGKKHWEQDFDKYARGLNYKFEEHFNKRTKDGWTELQLHEVMNLFGESLSNGMPNMFDMDIRIDTKKLMPI